MSTKKKFFELAAKHGIDVDYTAGGKSRALHHYGEIIPYFITLEAPKYKVFSATGCHCDCGIQGNENTTRTDWKEAVELLTELIDCGIVDCPHGAECEYCFPDEEE